MKPTLKEIEDNYERVLLQLDNGHLAGIRRLRSEDYYVVEQQDWNYHAVAIELSRGYNRESTYGYNIARIKFLDTKNELTDFMDYGSETDITDWDWYINNLRNLKFKKGNVVRICHEEFRQSYKQALGKVGTIVDAEYTQLIDDERITYRVRIDDSPNEHQANGLWVFHDESSLELYNPQCDDQMDVYTYSMAGTRYNMIEIDNIIKGEKQNMMSGILEIYKERRMGKINKKYDDMEEAIKQSDPRYKMWKECVDKLSELYKEDRVLTTEHFAPIKLSNECLEKLNENHNMRCKEFSDLSDKVNEVQAQLSMCETYEQKQDILRTYKIIKENGKVNA